MKNSSCFIILILLLLLSFKSIEKTLKNIRLISYNSETWSKIANDKGFIKQFESYLQGVNKIEDLAYVINSNKANINEVKQAFKELFKNKKDELFEIIRKNRNLSESLDIDNISDLTSEKISDIVEIIIKAP
ncbi:hypothetical protein [Capnocytophaga sputigena]|uniref:hypothetical protein n=1 Tax=Capnocytophaga sputigena TaxID=1019 RepID=UPI00241C1CB3